MQKTGAVLLGISPDSTKTQKQFLLALRTTNRGEVFLQELPIAKVIMRNPIAVAAVAGILLLVLAGAFAKPASSPADDRNSIVIVFKDGHRQSFTMAELARIDL